MRIVGLSFSSAKSWGKSRGRHLWSSSGDAEGLLQQHGVGRLSRNARSHPFKKSKLLWGCNFQVVIAEAFAGLALLGSKDVAEPMFFVGVRFGKKFHQNKFEVMPCRRGEVLATSLVKHADAAVEGSVFSIIPGSCYPMLDVIPMVPLVPGQVVQLEEKSLGPPLAGLSAALGKVVPLLEMLPFGRDETFQ